MTPLRTWMDGEWKITKHRDEDDEIVYTVAIPGGDDTEDFTCLESAREWIAYERNGATLDEIHELLGNLDLEDKATARKFKTVLAYLKK